MRKVLAHGALLGALLLSGALQAHAAQPSWISERIEARKQAISERIQAAQERICDRLAAVRDRTGHSRPLPPFCSGNGGGDDDDDDGEVNLTFSASDTSVDEGDTIELSWDSTNANSCTASNGWSGTKGVDGTKNVVVSTTTTYTLECENDDDSETKSVTVTTTPANGDDDDDDDAPGLSFSASPTSIEEGASSTLTWDSTNADSCFATDGWSGDKSVDGSQVVTPATTTTYTLHCTNENGTTTDSETVTVLPASGDDDDDDDLPDLTFSGNPTTIDDDATSTLTWNSTNADLCRASGGWSGTKALDGSQVVSPNSNTTYTLACGNENGTTTESVTITVVDVDLPLLTFTATPSTIEAGASSTLEWNSTDADLCVASGGWSGTKTLDGSQNVSPAATTTYILSCGNENGTTTATTTVSVTLEDAEVLPTLLFTLSTSTIEEGDEATLEWDSTNANSCTASNGWSGAKSVDGSEVVSPITTTTYVLSCENEDGSVMEDVTVTVVPDGGGNEADHLLISEVFYDPITSTTSSNQGTESANEWVEIYNPTESPVSMADWYLEDASLAIEFFGTTSIPAGGFLIMTNATSTANFWDFPEGTVFVFLGNPIGNGLGNTGDALYLKSPDDDFIDEVSWGSDTTGLNPAVPDADEGNSIARFPVGTDTDSNDDWIEANDPNPGE